MYRLLIADPSDAMVKLISKQLKNEMEIHRCAEGSKLVNRIVTLDPDFVYLDLQMLGQDGISTLQLLRSVGCNTKLIVASSMLNDVLYAQLTQYEVMYLLPKPCSSGCVVSCIRDLRFRLEHPDTGAWCLENEIDHMLLQLGFRMGPSRYRCVFEAVLERYRSPESSMKELYIDVAKRCGGNYQRIEKAVRDAVEDAYACGDHDIWALYFRNFQRKGKPYPRNEEFIARLAGALVQRSRIRKPFSMIQKEAK